MSDVLVDKVLHRVEMELQAVYAQQPISGLQLVSFEAHRAMAYDALIAEMRGFLLTEPAGDSTIASRTHWVKVKPWWLPRWLWRRIRVEAKTLTVMAHPKWSYPSTAIRVPDLNRPVRFVIAEASE